MLHCFRYRAVRREKDQKVMKFNRWKCPGKLKSFAKTVQTNKTNSLVYKKNPHFGENSRSLDTSELSKVLTKFLEAESFGNSQEYA